jgi:hypothetical protein
MLHTVKEERNILHTVKGRKVNWIRHILRRNCLLNHFIDDTVERRIEVMVRRGRRRKLLLDNLKERKGYCKMKEEVLDRTLWRNRFGIGCGAAVSQTVGRVNKC